MTSHIKRECRTRNAEFRSRSEQRLLVEVLGYDVETLTRTVDVHVAMLRQKLEDDPKQPRHFLTVRGLGYKFVDKPSDA